MSDAYEPGGLDMHTFEPKDAWAGGLKEKNKNGELFIGGTKPIIKSWGLVWQFCTSLLVGKWENYQLKKGGKLTNKISISH